MKKALHKSWVAALKAADADKNNSRRNEYSECLKADATTEITPSRKYPISLALLPGDDAGSIKGSIVYDRVGGPINIKGTVHGNQIKFNELDESGNSLSDIEVTWNGTKLVGSFTNLKSKKQMPFEAVVVKQ